MEKLVKNARFCQLELRCIRDGSRQIRYIAICRIQGYPEKCNTCILKNREQSTAWLHLSTRIDKISILYIVVCYFFSPAKSRIFGGSRVFIIYTCLPILTFPLEQRITLRHNIIFRPVAVKITTTVRGEVTRWRYVIHTWFDEKSDTARVRENIRIKQKKKNKNKNKIEKKGMHS